MIVAKMHWILEPCEVTQQLTNFFPRQNEDKLKKILNSLYKNYCNVGVLQLGELPGLAFYSWR
jgi:hypothetical protein